MGAAVARLGDGSNHGGVIISASSDVKANGTGVARDGDLHSCPIPTHGVTAINANSSVKANGHSIATVGSTTGCGATISSGSPNVNAS